MINLLVKLCGARFFSLQLPGYSLLMLDFLQAANTIISSNDLKGVSSASFPFTSADLLFASKVSFLESVFAHIQDQFFT